jgi:polar amino acid transport system permease protein
VAIVTRVLARPITIGRQLDRRLLLATLGALAILVSYALPMFGARITAAHTRFSLGTSIESHFPVLISGQHYNQAHTPLNEELASVSIDVAPVPYPGNSGYGWLARVAASPYYLGQHASFVLAMVVPLLSALTVGGYGVITQGTPQRRPGWIPALIHVAVAGPIALLLAWLHQFDFSLRLYQLADGALLPQPAYWIALLGSMAAAGGALRLRRETIRRVATWWLLVIAVALGVWLLTRARPQPFLEIWAFISDGILVTLRIVVTSFGFILLVSLFGGLGRISRNPLIYGASSLYVEVVRGIPLLVQLLFIWFALPQVFDIMGAALIAISPVLADAGQWLVDLRLDPYAAAVLGLTICYGAYGSEIFRAGISSIHHGQMEAARSLGMNSFQAMRYIILPQAVRVILPPVGNEFVALLKDSSLVSVLAVSDLTRRGREYMARTFLSFDTWIMVALCYLVLTLFSSRVVEYIESKSRFER